MLFNVSISAPNIIYIGSIKMLITDFIGIFVWLILMLHYNIKIVEDKQDGQKMEFISEKQNKMFRSCISSFFEFLKWIIIIGVFEAAAIKTKANSIGFIYAASMSLLIFYMVLYLNYPIKKLIFSTQNLRERSKAMNTFFLGLITIGFIAVTIALGYVIEIISGVILQISSGK
jgi:hypothetical protein